MREGHGRRGFLAALLAVPAAVMAVLRPEPDEDEVCGWCLERLPCPEFRRRTCAVDPVRPLSPPYFCAHGQVDEWCTTCFGCETCFLMGESGFPGGRCYSCIQAAL